MRILSGIQPSGALHLGNYYGMMRRALMLQNEGEAVYFIADYHALTTVHDAKALRENVWHVAAAFLACGLDPRRSLLFRQSAVPEVHELAWLLSIVTPVGLLERCHSYKDKIARGIQASHGLFAYPVLMAADILLYQADRVPVGKDQKQHIEVARDLAMKFNHIFGEVFRVPEPDIQETVAVVPGLDGQKMSKSYRNTIELFCSAKATEKKIMAIKTDSTPVEAPKPIEGSLLIAFYRLVATADELQEWIASMQRGGIGYGEYKRQLAAKLNQALEPIRERYLYYENHRDEVWDILKEGGVRARGLAKETLERAREVTGIS
ncbi:MAG: tryptophan--tRNA ligase [Methylacidiphilales bacterium]|nr:tryptophan--tRNA ligase [Candidatus Methylacidiphilales bacterium]MDW8348942.1 tryptophan--tRNA ligase [Verrucomicrobiae bacterium]